MPLTQQTLYKKRNKIIKDFKKGKFFNQNNTTNIFNKNKHFIKNNENVKFGDKNHKNHLLKSSKYCSFHKCNTHSDSKCFAQKNKLKSYSLKEPKVEIEPIQLDGIINNIPVKMLLDTGAEHNYIS